MKKISVILLTAFALSCGSKTDNPGQANTNNPMATPPPVIVSQDNSNAVNTNNANSAGKKDEPVPTFTDPAAAFAAGDKYLDGNETEKAIESYKQAVKLNPDLAEAHFKLGVAYALIETEKEAAGEISQTEPSPTKTPRKGKEVLKKRDSEKAFQEAVKAYKKIVGKNPKDDAAYFNLGRAYNKLNDDKEAEKALRQAVKLKPDDSEYQTELGAILIKFAKYEEALVVLKKALSLDSTNFQAEDLIEVAQAGKKRIDYGKPKDKPIEPR